MLRKASFQQQIVFLRVSFPQVLGHLESTPGSCQTPGLTIVPSLPQKAKFNSQHLLATGVTPEIRGSLSLFIPAPCPRQA